jgi:hypothetical protein
MALSFSASKRFVIVSLFNDNLSATENDVQGSGPGLLYSITSEFVWRN